MSIESRFVFKILVLSVLIVCSVTSTTMAQAIAIPDTNFYKALVEFGFDKDKNGKIEVAEALLCDSIQINHRNIVDITGIEEFKNLRFLDFSYNMITKIDLSGNPKLYKVDLLYNKILDINVSKNTELLELYCGSNGIKNIDLSNNAKLKKFVVLYNPINTFDLSNNPNLTYIDAGWSRITSLDVSKNPKLAYLDVRGNTDLSSICVFDTNYAKSNLKFKKDATQKWTQNCTVTGISSEELETNSYEQTIYPNPTYEEAYLKIPNLTEPIQLKVTDMSGRTMFEQLVSTQETEINTSQLSAGTYYLSFILNNKVINKKMTVMK